MNTPSRREFFTYAAATLASALPASAQTKNDQSKTDARLLVVDVIGPMAFQWSGSRFDVWMPNLDAQSKSHEAGITTPLLGFRLLTGNYQIQVPGVAAGNPVTLHRTGGSQIYAADTSYHPKVSEPPKEYFIYLSLPKPFHIALLHPLLAKIWPSGDKEPSGSTFYAVGVRLLYPNVGVPTLTPLPSGVPADGWFDPDSAELQLDMSISYLPQNVSDDDVKESFKALANLLNLKLEVKLDESRPIIQEATFQHPCKSPVMRLT